MPSPFSISNAHRTRIALLVAMIAAIVAAPALAGMTTYAQHICVRSWVGASAITPPQAAAEAELDDCCKARRSQESPCHEGNSPAPAGDDSRIPGEGHCSCCIVVMLVPAWAAPMPVEIVSFAALCPDEPVSVDICHPSGWIDLPLRPPCL